MLITRPGCESDPDHVALQIHVQDPVEDVCDPQQSLQGIRRSTLLCPVVGKPSSGRVVIAELVLTGPRDLGMVKISSHRETLAKGVEFLAAPDHRQILSTQTVLDPTPQLLGKDRVPLGVDDLKPSEGTHGEHTLLSSVPEGDFQIGILAYQKVGRGCRENAVKLLHRSP